MIYKKNKFNAKRSEFDGKMYDSKAERDYRIHLDLLEKAGEISDIEEQPRIELEPDIFFKPDFSFWENGRKVFVDVKGVETERFRLICKIWRLHGPAPLRIIKRGGVRQPWRVTKTIIPM